MYSQFIFLVMGHHKPPFTY